MHYRLNFESNQELIQRYTRTAYFSEEAVGGVIRRRKDFRL